MKITTIANIILAIVALILVSLMFTNDTKATSNIDQVKAKNYLTNNALTDAQADYIISRCDMVRDCDHFIMRFGAIFRHENGSYGFVEGQSTYVAGRLKKSMAGKSFELQLDDWIRAYNKYWRKHNTVSGWIDTSRYCVSDTHGGGEGCPNWRKNVGSIIKKYQLSTKPIEEEVVEKKKAGYYITARNKQDVADKAREECKKVGECIE